MFERVPRPVTNPGKGGLWRIIPWILESIPKSTKKRKQEEATSTCVNSPYLADLQTNTRPVKNQLDALDIHYINNHRSENRIMSPNFMSQKGNPYRQQSYRDIIGQTDPLDEHSYHNETGSYPNDNFDHDDKPYYYQQHAKEKDSDKKEMPHKHPNYRPKILINNLPFIRSEAQKLNPILHAEDQNPSRQNSKDDIHSIYFPENLPKSTCYEDTTNNLIQQATPKKRNHLMDTLAELALSVQHNYEWQQKFEAPVSPADELAWNISNAYPKSPFMYRKGCPDELAEEREVPGLNPMLGGQTLLQATFSETETIQLSD